MGASASIAYSPNYKVFLGGSCNPTTWRKDIACPMLDKHAITYYNPQVDDWHTGLIEVEKQAKNNAKILLFVIDNQTRGIASISEAAYYMGAGRKVVLVVQKFSSEANNITTVEFADLNRGRVYLEDIAKITETPVFDNVDSAINFIVNMLK
jgi:hypothetical protein